MINIQYTNNEIKVDVQNVSKIYKTPLYLSVVNSVNRNEIWGCELNDYSWATYPNNEMVDVIIYDNHRNTVVYRKWSVLVDGDYLYKTIYLYCKNFVTRYTPPLGLAIGTHDGEFGEWVPCVINKISDVLLIEASVPQYEKLVENYRHFDNVKTLNCLVTTDGKPVEFFEGGRGYTNSVVESVIRGWEKEEISSSVKESSSVNEIIINEMGGHIDWLHLDVEGYDAKLIMSINEGLLPRLIIFENNNMDEYEKRTINGYLTQRGYSIKEEKVSTLAIK